MTPQRCWGVWLMCRCMGHLLSNGQELAGGQAICHVRVPHLTAIVITWDASTGEHSRPPLLPLKGIWPILQATQHKSAWPAKVNAPLTSFLVVMLHKRSWVCLLKLMVQKLPSLIEPALNAVMHPAQHPKSQIMFLTLCTAHTPHQQLVVST